ncbi:MAG TPA: HD-GYP domain-containing protein [Candidatus Methylomirabilis sp.]|nr:HD-GYP domain-containing protein [Candidatus Methylomirabilis sp.]
MTDSTGQAATPRPASELKLRQIMEGVVDQGRILVADLHKVLKNAQVHARDNEAFLRPLSGLAKTLQALRALQDRVVLRLVDEYVFIGDHRLRMDISGYMSFQHVLEVLKRWRLGTLALNTPLTDAQLIALVDLLLSWNPEDEDPYITFVAGLRRAGLDTITVGELKEGGGGGMEAGTRDSRLVARRTFFKAVAVIKEVVQSVEGDQVINLRKVKRVVQAIVDDIMRDELFLLGLTTLKNYDEYTTNHSANVCVLSVSMGSRMGFSKNDLEALGMSAFFHDIGKTKWPKELLNKEGKPTPEEWRMMQMHPCTGVTALLKLKGLSDAVLRSALAVFEHHLHWDRSGGYPSVTRPRDPSLFARIIAIVDCFDALTSSRAYRKSAFRPDQALKMMLETSGTAFDPVLMKLFINTVGIFPIGTLVLLGTGEVALVLAPNPNPEYLHLPRVKILFDVRGNPVEPETIDLAASNGAGPGDRQIIRSLDPEAYGVKVAEHFHQVTAA